MSTDANKKNNNLHEEKKVSDVLIRSMTDRKKKYLRKKWLLSKFVLISKVTLGEEIKNFKLCRFCTRYLDVFHRVYGLLAPTPITLQ